MKPKGRQKADYAVRHPFAGLSQTALLSQVRVCKGVESATDALKVPGVYETPQIYTRDSVTLKLTGSKHARFANQSEEFLCWRLCAHILTTRR